MPGSRRSPREGNGYPPQCSFLGNPKDRGTWQATVHGGHKKVGHDLATNQQQRVYYRPVSKGEGDKSHIHSVLVFEFVVFKGEQQRR